MQLVSFAPFSDYATAFSTMVHLLTMFESDYFINVYYATPPLDPTRVYILSNCRHAAYSMSQVRLRLAVTVRWV